MTDDTTEPANRYWSDPGADDIGKDLPIGTVFLAPLNILTPGFWARLYRTVFRHWTERRWTPVGYVTDDLEFTAVGEGEFTLTHNEPGCGTINVGNKSLPWIEVEPGMSVKMSADNIVAESDDSLNPFTDEEIMDAEIESARRTLGIPKDWTSRNTTEGLVHEDPKQLWRKVGEHGYIKVDHCVTPMTDDPDDYEPHQLPAGGPGVRVYTWDQLAAMSEADMVEDTIDFLEATLNYPLQPWQATALRRILGGYTDAELINRKYRRKPLVKRNFAGEVIHGTPSYIMVDEAYGANPHPFNDGNQGYYCCRESGCGKHRDHEVHNV